MVQVFVQDEKLYYVLESAQEIDYAALKHWLDKETMLRWQLTSKAIYVMKKSYKNHLFDERVTPDRGVCGIKLPTVLSGSPKQADIAMIIE